MRTSSRVALAFLAVLLGGATAADAQFFREARTLTVPGANPRTAAMAGDFNGDGIADLAVDYVDARAGQGMRVFLGLGGGAFGPPIESAGVPGWRGVAAGDLNEDGKLDLFVGNGAHWVLLGDGAGHFTIQQIPLALTRSLAMLADMNHDGHLDLVGAELDAHRFSLVVHRGDGTGAFGAPTVKFISTSEGGMAVGDLTGDGAPDVVATDPDGRFFVVLNDGSGGFLPATFTLIGSGTRSVALGDLNGDGRLDGVVSNPAAGTLLVLLGNGPGTFAAPVEYPGPGPAINPGFAQRSVSLADMDQDGRLDVVATVGGVWVYRGLGTGALAPPVRYVAAGLPAVADLDGDGKRDVAAGNAILINQGSLNFDAPRQFGVGGAPRALATADLNHDGRADLVTANRDTDDVSVLLGNGDGTFSAAISVPAGDAPHRLALADLNADGHVDIAAANHDSGNVSILLGNGAGAFVPLPAVPAGPAPEGLAAGDLNGDFLNDLAVATPAGIEIRLGAGGGTFVTGTTQALLGPGTAVAVANLNPDYSPDLVAGDNTTGAPLATMLGIGGAQFLAPRYPELSTSSQTTVVPTDFDGDTSTDVASGGPSGPRVLRGDGVGGLTEVPIAWTDRLLVADDPGVAAADFTRDGKGDVVTGSVSLLIGNGTSFSVYDRPLQAAGRVSALASADFNGDGQPDLAAALREGDVVDILLNQAASPGADLSVAVTHSPDPAVPSGPLTFTITASNSGPLPAKGVRVGFHLPYGVGLRSTPPNCVVTNQSLPPSLLCTLGDIATAGSASVAVPVTVSATFGFLETRADVDAVEPRDLDPFDNEVTHLTPVGLPADLTVTVEDSVDPVAPGALFTYTLQVTNVGTGAPAEVVEVSDFLPDGVTFVSVSAPGCQYARPNVVCGFAPIPAGQSISFTIDVQAQSFTTATNVVRVQQPGETNVANNEASEETRMDLATGRELLHGTQLQERFPSGSSDRIYFVRQEPRSSYEVVVDGLAGDVATPGGSVLLERLDDNLAPVQAAVAVGSGPARSLRWENTRATAVVEAVRVRSTGCGTTCDAGDVYRIRAWETTGRIARFRNVFTQVTVLVLQNPLPFDVHATVWWWSDQGAPIASQAVTIAPRETFRLITSTIVPGQQGSVTVTHDAPYGSLAGKAIALEPGTGFSFDTMMLTPPR